jgi:hypothetical protein
LEFWVIEALEFPKICRCENLACKAQDTPSVVRHFARYSLRWPR